MSALTEQAAQFARQVEELLRSTVCATPPDLDLQERESEEGLAVVVRSSPSSPALLTVKSSPILRLDVSYRFRLGRDLEFLRVDSSSFQVWSMVQKVPPLFRYDYLDSPRSQKVPQAHVQVHAHRDELLHAMYISDRSRSTPTRKKRLDPAEPRGLHMIHFPVGGARFRPCLEDVVELVVNEFGLDTRPDWQERVRDGRAQWRRVQLAAAVRDDPGTARQALAKLSAQASTDEDRLRRI